MNPNNDHTVYTSADQGFANPAPAPNFNGNGMPPQGPPMGPNMPPKGESASSTAAKVGLGVVGGGVLGAGAMFAADAFAGTPDISDEALQEVASAIEGEGQGMAMAHVNDHMSFADAFAAARAEVGPGGVFIWRGGVYGTYTADEWNAMSPEARAAFTDNAMDQYGGEAAHHGHAHAHHVVHEDHVIHHHHVHHEGAAGGAAGTQAGREGSDLGNLDGFDTGDDGGETGEEDGGLRVLGTRVEQMEGRDVTVADIEYQGHSGILVDVDQDGNMDYAGVDYNDNGQIDSNEVISLNDGGSTGGVGEGMDDGGGSVLLPPEDDPLADTPPDDPYVNNGGVQVIETDEGDGGNIGGDIDQGFGDNGDGGLTAENTDGGDIDNDPFVSTGSGMDDDNMDVYVAENTSSDGMDDFVNDANVDMMA